MGRNGAGKSTLLRAVAGLLSSRSAGTIEAPGGCALLPQSPADLLLRERVADELAGRGGSLAHWRRWTSSGRPNATPATSPAASASASRSRSSWPGARTERVPGSSAWTSRPAGWTAARKDELAEWLGELAADGARGARGDPRRRVRRAFAERVVLLGDGELIADGPADEILSGGWYFATEVARILGGEGAITPEAGAIVLREAIARVAAEVGSP